MNFVFCTQLLVVVSSDWHATHGMLYRFERDSSVAWELVSSPIPVDLGKRGMAWGRGLFDVSHERGAYKKEGDGKSPAGLFFLGPAFGDALHQLYAKRIPFLLITDDLECIDDSHSAYYNQFVNANSVMNRDWKSSEKMQDIGFSYAMGIVIQHNMHPIERGMGSAIFMHIWEEKRSGTAGCTAMSLDHMQEIIAWLDIRRSPCLVQLPIQEYIYKQGQWGLPELESICTRPVPDQ